VSTRNWQKSSYSGSGSNCLYVATGADGTVHIRESDEPDVIVTTTSATLRALIQGIKAAEFDHFAR
jgi:hypothetical protein